MPQYDIHALCPLCGKFHDLYVRVELAEYFEVRTLSDLYEAGLLSRNLLIAISRIACPQTQEHFSLPSPDQLVVVSVTVKNDSP